MDSLDGLAETADFYARFAAVDAAGESETFAAWADGVSRDEEVLRLLGELPPERRQPNLLFAAARWHGAPTPSGYEAFRRRLQADWASVSATMSTRTTQTNEPGRCATLLPLLDLIGAGRPLALLEVGASGGLCLHPDRYSYRYRDADGDIVGRLDPAGGPSSVVLDCRLTGEAAVPEGLPQVVWRGGIDLNPLDVTDPETRQWLATLVWPEHHDRRERLEAAADLVAGLEPGATGRGEVRVGDAAGGDLEDLVIEAERAVAESHPEAVLVILHTAVAAYFPHALRQTWPDRMRALCAQGPPRHWISQEGPGVLPGVSETATCIAEDDAAFCLALDGGVRAWTHGHGRALQWCPQQ